MNKRLLFIPVTLCCLSSFAQVEIDNPIEMTGGTGQRKVTNLESPTQSTDAANKHYVDSLVTANAGGVTLDFTFTASASSVSGGSSNNNTPAITLTATAFAGTITPINVSVSGVPAGASYTLTPSAGYPVPALSMSLVFNITSVSPGSYPITVTATGGITPKVLNLTLVILAKRVFVTSTTQTGNFGGLSGADALCQTRANAAGLGSTWKAWLSTSSVNAKDRIADATYVRLDGVVVASNKADLIDGSITNAISIDEFGANNTFPGVWTGTNTAGTVDGSLHCSSWSSTGSSGMLGRANQSDYRWTAECCGGVGCSNNYRLYCFEQ